jgi:Lon protease-like protein
MSNSGPKPPQPLDFSRPIPLFPLPNCVLFPGAVQPLHLFEPRYRQLLIDTLKDQSAIALGLLKPGWEKDYYGSPPVYEILCAGSVIAHEKTADGNFNLLLHGVCRARMVRQQKAPPTMLYRTVTLEPLEETPPSPAHEPLQRQVLRDMLAKTALKDLTITPSLDAYFHPSVPTGRLVDLLAFNLVQDIPSRQRLLEEIDTRKRADLLLQNLLALVRQLDPAAARQAMTQGGAWPPPLSTN